MSRFKSLQQLDSIHHMRDSIISLMVQNGLEDDCYIEMLDYAINLFESQGFGTDYYGYHNINHELEVTYTSLLAANQDLVKLNKDDIKHLYISALFHDFDPQKNVDKPHEESVIKTISSDQELQRMLKRSKTDLEIIKVLILRTTYPWSGKLKENAESQIAEFFNNSDRTRDDSAYQQHVMEMGSYLSIVDRISTYALGDFKKAMEMAKMNAHALAWRPSVIVRNAVAYFEDILNKEPKMLEAILDTIPKNMRKNFFDTVLLFMKLRQQEIAIQADYVHENLKLVPTIENMSTRQDPKFIDTLYRIFLELPTPLQFERENFEYTIRDPERIINTLRRNDQNGRIIGFAKGGPLEKYKLRDEIHDENYGAHNTIFLEPLALTMGYWGLKGGSEMRHLFIMQAHALKYKFLTSFALREVIQTRVDKEKAEFVTRFDPERWDYYRVRL